MNSPRPYAHTQIGWTSLGIASLLLAVLVPVAWLLGAGILAIVVLLLFGVIAAFFGTLTVRVDDQSLTWAFGVGVLRRRINLGDIRGVRDVRNPWYLGWGIRPYRGGTLYNVSGLSAVELVLSNERRIRIGTDEPDRLLSALRARLPSSMVVDA